MSTWLRGAELERLATAARTSPQQAERFLEALEAHGYLVTVRRDMVAMVAAAERVLRHQPQQERPSSSELRPIGECKGCGRDRRHVLKCCPDCGCHSMAGLAR